LEEGNYYYFFGICASEDGIVKKKNFYYNQIQEMLHKTNENDYILPSGDMNTSIGNS